MPPESRHGRASGSWVFCDRRWLSPADPADLARLQAGYDALCAAFPAFASCPRDHFLACLEHVSEAWVKAGAPRRAGNGAAGLAAWDLVPPSRPPADGGRIPSSRPGHLAGPVETARAGRNGHHTPLQGAGGRRRGDSEAGPAAATIAIPRLLNRAPVSGSRGRGAAEEQQAPSGGGGGQCDGVYVGGFQEGRATVRSCT